MPTYEYLCESCASRFDRLQRMSAPPLEQCPSCGGPVRRVLAPGAAILTSSPGRDRLGSRHSSGACEHEQPCCGRDRRCDRPPCGER